MRYKLKTLENGAGEWRWQIQCHYAETECSLEYLESGYCFENEDEAIDYAKYLAERLGIELIIEQDDEEENELGTCHYCGGSGQGIADGLICSTCGGEGVV